MTVFSVVASKRNSAVRVNIVYCGIQEQSGFQVLQINFKHFLFHCGLHFQLLFVENIFISQSEVLNEKRFDEDVAARPHSNYAAGISTID